MHQEHLRQLGRQLGKNKFLIAKPSTDVFMGVQAFIVLIKGVKTKDWLLAQQLMSCSLPQMIESLIEKKVETQNLLQCQKLMQVLPQSQTLLGKQIYQLLQTSLNYMEIGTIGKVTRSKSSILPRRAPSSQETNAINNKTKYLNATRIGNLVKSYKDDIQRMLNNRKSLKKSFVAERTNRNVELLKEHIKKVNKNSYFVSPRKVQHDKGQCFSQDSSQVPLRKQIKSFRSFRKSFLE